MGTARPVGRGHPPGSETRGQADPDTRLQLRPGWARGKDLTFGGSIPKSPQTVGLGTDHAFSH